jgi:predicted transcriptional regulator YdeE
MTYDLTHLDGLFKAGLQKRLQAAEGRFKVGVRELWKSSRAVEKASGEVVVFWGDRK